MDTRAITKKLRSSGTMRAIMADEGADVQAVVKLLKEPISCMIRLHVYPHKSRFPSIPWKKVVLMDFGAKHGIIRELSRRSCDLVVVPYNTSAEAILALHPDGVMLSNGPGDPKDMTGAIEVIRELIKHVPSLASVWDIS